jgi:precorrin-6B methylase 2
VRRALGIFLAALALQVFAEQGEECPPFITTPDTVVEHMLELAGTGPNDVVMDLGSGDGRIVIAAARKFGARGIGIELDDKLVAASRENARLAKVADRVSFVHGDVLSADISPASVVTLYLLPSLIQKLQPRLIYELKPGTRIVSHAFAMAGWRPDGAQTVRESTLFLWIVPAEIRGVWQAAGSRVRIHQSYQEIELEGELSGKPLVAARGGLTGHDVAWQSDGGRFHGRLAGDKIVGELERDGARAPLVLERVR